jgi:glyoxylase-like metal-dependent hydrolase (beta-lactamase superfamily II)
MELRQGLYLIPKIKGANSYAVTEEAQGDDRIMLIDTGMPGNAGKIVDFLKSLGNEHLDRCTIVITHPDIDHSGSVAELKGKLGSATVAIHEADAPRLAGEKPLREVHGLPGLLFKALSPFMRFTPVTPDVQLKDGEHVDALTVIHTPGHTEGSICLYSERLKAMFVGDALRTDSNRNPILPSAALAFDFEEAKNSVRKIASYEFDLLLSGHGPPVLADASRKVKELIA